MFFKTTDLNISNFSAFNLSWEKRNDYSDIRPYHALSMRVTGDAVFKHQKGITNVKSGDIVFVPSYYPYTLISGQEQLFVIHFTSDTEILDSIKSFTPQNSAYFQRKFEEFYNIWQKKELGYKHECKSIFFKILTHIERNYDSKKNHIYEDKISEAIDYIHENYITENISIEHLAKICNISSAYLRKLFHTKYKISPQRYINNLKLQYAIELLKSGYYSVSEVSDMCNFQNIYYFSSFIKKETGISPSKICGND